MQCLVLYVWIPNSADQLRLCILSFLYPSVLPSFLMLFYLFIGIISMSSPTTSISFTSFISNHPLYPFLSLQYCQTLPSQFLEVLHLQTPPLHHILYRYNFYRYYLCRLLCRYNLFRHYLCRQDLFRQDLLVLRRTQPLQAYTTSAVIQLLQALYNLCR